MTAKPFITFLLISYRGATSYNHCIGKTDHSLTQWVPVKCLIALYSGSLNPCIQMRFHRVKKRESTWRVDAQHLLNRLRGAQSQSQEHKRMIVSPALTIAGSYRKVKGEGSDIPRPRGGNNSRGLRARRIICLSDVLGPGLLLLGVWLVLLNGASRKWIRTTTADKGRGNLPAWLISHSVYRRGAERYMHANPQFMERKSLRQLPKEIQHGTEEYIFFFPF